MYPFTDLTNGKAMNRKQRRAQAKAAPKAVTPAASQTITVPQALDAALRHHQNGQLSEAEAIYRSILAVDANHSDALHLLGVVAHQVGRCDVAVDLIGKAIAINGTVAAYYSNYGLVLRALDRLDEALASYDAALRIKPDYAEAHYNRGIALKGIGRLDEALASYDTALRLKPDYAEAHSNRGNALKDLGRLDEALASYDAALRVKPDCAEAHSNRGNALKDLGRLDEALASYDAALRVKPDYAEAHYNRGIALYDLGRLDEALASYVAALRVKPDYAEAHSSRGVALKDLGRLDEAIDLALTLLNAHDTIINRRLFANTFKSWDDGIDLMAGTVGLTEVAIRALSEGWCRPSSIARSSLRLIKKNSGVRAGIDLAMRTWPVRPTTEMLFGNGRSHALNDDRLLQALLCSTPIPDLGMERFLTGIRLGMLDLAGVSPELDEDALGFWCAMARQCFINEYVFICTDDENARAQCLRDGISVALANGEPISPIAIAVAAAYAPLHSLPEAKRLLDRTWPQAVKNLLTQQIEEPLEEANLRTVISRLTPVDDDVSMNVKNQYEESPYPRWIVPGVPNDPLPLDRHVRRICPLASFRNSGRSEAIDILIAGCGSGQHPIESALSFPKARILAIDLSLTSLSYAMRKTRELGVGNIEYGQADILQLGCLNPTFDLIESCGVLHHLEDPMRGWRELLALLRPGGFMRLGLYSEEARRAVVAARDFIAERGYGQGLDDIRRCRQEMMAKDGPWNQVLGWTDFYSLSECRDLLFHVQEHRFTIDQIAAFLSCNGLRFLGFEAEPSRVQHYRQCFPEDPAAVDLALWHRFEVSNPTFFAGMYQFWVQKPA